MSSSSNVVNTNDYMSYVFGGVVALGGFVGYVKAGSLMSLGSGVLFGILISYGAYRVSINPTDFMFLLTVCGVLTVTMGYRFYLSGKFMPAGLVASLSFGQVIRFGIRYLQG